ncbi:MAG TPA: integrase arm-type DNA-binding domain-containing protein [Acidobacteriaceae bacterium]|nr:integrase arm-type DNA-binding domain-containing protein [Acidobacteriaceae bacterium]
MPLTDVALRSLKTDVPRKIFDGRGLYLEVTAAGSRLWRMKYRFAGKEKRLSLGSYPEVSLKAARAAHAEKLALLARGIDPSAERKSAANATGGSFETVAREWIASREPIWAPGNTARIKSLFENDLFPYLGSRPLCEITAPELLVTIRRIERRVLERAHRALMNCGQVFRYGVATGRCERNPAADLRGALPPYKSGHFAAPTDPKLLAPLLRAMYSYEGTPAVTAALRLAPLVFVRPGELRKAEWADVDLDAAEWRYVASKTKVPHLVPLARQAVEILRELLPVTGRSRFVFPSARSKDRPMSDNAVLAALRRSEISKEELSGHGLRATARTILDEVLSFRPDIIEHQLAHVVKDPNGRAYNRTAHIEERRRMMQAWADYLDTLRRAEVVPFAKRA